MHPSPRASSTSSTSTPISPIAETGFGRISTARRADEAGAATHTASLTAPIPGTVLKVNMADGDTFEAHDSLIVLESMKMEMLHTPSHSWWVDKVRCQVGDLVAPAKPSAKLSHKQDPSGRG